jgi:hypothetical protein
MSLAIGEDGEWFFILYTRRPDNGLKKFVPMPQWEWIHRDDKRIAENALPEEGTQQKAPVIHLTEDKRQELIERRKQQVEKRNRGRL